MTDAKTGLIVVDLQEAFCPPETVVRAIRTIMPRYDFVIAMRFINKPNSIFETELDFTKCYEGAEDARILVPTDKAIVLDHATFGLTTVQIDHLRTYNVARWDIAGCDTHACVLSTCFNLFDNGVKFQVLKDMCATSKGDEIHQASFKIMEMCFAQFQKPEKDGCPSV